MAGTFRGKPTPLHHQSTGDHPAESPDMHNDTAHHPANNKSPMISHTSRTIRSDPAPFRWICPCKRPPVLLATYDPGGKLNIKVRDRYWHLFGFGTIQAICPRCAAEHTLDLRYIRDRIDHAARTDRRDDDGDDVEF